MKSPNEALRRARGDRRLTEVGEATCIPWRTIAAYERGECNPSPKRLWALVEFYGVPASALGYGIDTNHLIVRTCP